ncbi:hypothetical protein [Gordonia sp. CNJ-863]|uniref:hypothetical protein n=1 Tax=Gordonia sp. CNJ-863 TaxID=1904963 RepID=UPI0011153D7F|nr:hypothetical protein [Gordonia sp. CNJ-863]
MTQDAKQTHIYIPSSGMTRLKHGVPVGVVLDQTTIDLRDYAVDGKYLDHLQGQSVLDALQAEVRRDVGVFGDSRMSKLI